MHLLILLIIGALLWLAVKAVLAMITMLITVAVWGVGLAAVAIIAWHLVPGLRRIFCLTWNPTDGFTRSTGSKPDFGHGPAPRSDPRSSAGPERPASTPPPPPPPPDREPIGEPKWPYQTLGVRPTASFADIKAAYLRQALAQHPDRCRDPGASARMAQVNAAWEWIQVNHSRPG